VQAQHWKNLEEWCEDGSDTHIESYDVEWTSDDPDPVAISRLKKSGNSQGILEERVLPRRTSSHFPLLGCWHSWKRYAGLSSIAGGASHRIIDSTLHGQSHLP
jgi:hypothetical protein